MVLNYIWVGFFLIAFFVGLTKLLAYHDYSVFEQMITAAFDMAGTAFELAIGLTGILAFWLGFMKIGEKGGAINKISWLIGPFFNKIFPEVPKNHPANGAMIMNFSANMLGLDNAATPLGLKAMENLQELNPEKKKASNAQIMFLVLNTSGLTLIPVSVMTYRGIEGAASPADIFIPILLATFCSSIVGFFTVAIIQKINLFNKVVLSYLLILLAAFIGFVYFLVNLSEADLKIVSGVGAYLTIFSIIVWFLILGLIRKINIYETFIEGAVDGFKVAIKIIPYLVAILVAIAVFRASGAMDFFVSGIEWSYVFIASIFSENPPTEFIEGLPTAIMKPLSGSGARGMMIDSFQTHGVDSFVGRLTSVFQGSTETTFYVLAVYFGSVGIRNSRYAIACGLLADLAGIIAAIFFTYLFFG